MTFKRLKKVELEILLMAIGHNLRKVYAKMNAFNDKKSH